MKRIVKSALWILLAAVCGFVGVFMVRMAFQRVQEMRTIERIPRVAVADLIPGEANLSGQVAFFDGKQLRAPDTQSPCVYYHYTVERKTRDSDGDVRWETIESKYAYVPFILNDGSGKIVIYPEHTKEMTVSLASRHSRTQGDYRYNESRIDPGMTVFAMGVATRRNGESELSLAFKGEGRYVPILSVRGEAKERGSVGFFSLLLTGLGLLGLSLGIYALTRGVGIQMTLVYLLLVTLTVSLTLTIQANRMIKSDLLSAFERLEHERGVRAAEVTRLLDAVGIEWDGQWDSLGPMLEKQASAPMLSSDAAAAISTHRVNLMRAMVRAERIRRGFPERWIASRMKLPEIEDFGLTDDETQQLLQHEKAFEPSRISAFSAVLVGGGGLFLAVLFALLGVRRIKVKRWIENIPTVKVKGVVYGINEIKGTAVMPAGGDALTGPISGKPCSYYHYVIKEKRRSGKNTKWVTIKDEKQSVPFLCRDASGELMIDPKGAEIISKTRSNRREGRLRHEETRLPIGSPMYAIGTAGIDPKTHDRLQMVYDREAKLPFLLSDLSENELVARKAAVGFLLLNLGLNAFSMAGLSLAGWQGGFGVLQYQLAALAPLFYMLLFFLVVLFNDLVFLRQRCDAMWANIDVSLKKRFDLLPKLVATVQAYREHEQSLQVSLAQRRSGAGPIAPGEAGNLEAEAVEAVNQVNGLFEAYPDLKANTLVKDLMQRMRDLEDEIALMREGYNQAVDVYNTRIHRIPDVLLARMGGFRDREFFTID